VYPYTSYLEPPASVKIKHTFSSLLVEVAMTPFRVGMDGFLYNKCMPISAFQRCFCKTYPEFIRVYKSSTIGQNKDNREETLKHNWKLS